MPVNRRAAKKKKQEAPKLGTPSLNGVAEALVDHFNAIYHNACQHKNTMDRLTVQFNVLLLLDQVSGQILDDMRHILPEEVDPVEILEEAPDTVVEAAGAYLEAHVFHPAEEKAKAVPAFLFQQAGFGSA